MKVKEAMTQPVKCARPDDTIATAAELMRDMDIGGLPVCEDGDKLVGMITDRDITIRATAEGRDPGTLVRDVMTRNVVHTYDDESVEDAAQLMEKQQIRRLMVLDRNEQLAGILSLGDVAIESRNERLAGEALEAISQPTDR